jgi:toxin YoeB
MEIVYSPTAGKHLEIIKKSGSPATKKRLKRILEDILEHPYTGFASPEELKYDLAGIAP